METTEQRKLRLTPLKWDSGSTLVRELDADQIGMSIIERIKAKACNGAVIYKR